MAQGKSKLDWTSITTADMSPDTVTALELFIDAKVELEKHLANDAIASGAAQPGATFAFAYRSLPHSVGMAITNRSQRSTGFAGLKKPVATLAQYVDNAKAEGRNH